jgi:hypothetical protein
MITVTATVGSTFYDARLPYKRMFRPESERPSVQALSLAGTTIHQALQKSDTAAIFEYEAQVPTADAAKLRAIDEGAITCVMSDGFRLYEAECDAKIGRAIQAGKVNVQAVFKIVRRIL